jgi:transposase
MRPSGTAQELEARRLRAAELLRQNLGPSAVARIVGASPGTVARWKQALDQGGKAALQAKPHPGRKPFLSARQKQQLLQLLLKGARQAGYANDLWTCPRVAELIERKFGVRYHPDWVGQILHALGWSVQKPQRRSRERDEATIARWRAEEWPRIKKGARRSS